MPPNMATSPMRPTSSRKLLTSARPYLSDDRNRSTRSRRLSKLLIGLTAGWPMAGADLPLQTYRERVGHSGNHIRYQLELPIPLWHRVVLLLEGSPIVF